MADVNPYVNTFGRALTIFTENGSNWATSALLTAGAAGLPPDSRGRNIWDSQTNSVLTFSNRAFSGTPTSRAWILPSPDNAGDIDSVNAIVINNSNINHVTPNNVVISAGQTTGTLLPLGVITFGRLLTVQPVNGTSSSTDRSQPFQVQPLPDQIVTINSNLTITVASRVGSQIPMTTLSIHNCFANIMWMQIRLREGEPGQNLGQINANQTLRLRAFSTDQIFLISSNSRTMSGVFTIPTGSVSNTIFFQSNGSVSLISCTGAPIPPIPIPPPGPTPPPTPPPVGRTFMVTWNTTSFPANGTGQCSDIRVGDTIQFRSTDGQTHDLIQSSSSWVALTNPRWRFPASSSFNQSIPFTTAGCFFFISQPQSTRMRLRVSVTNTDGSGGCTTPCPSRPDVITPPLVPVQPVDDDQSFLERWWWAILICIIIVIIIIIFIIWAAWPKTPSTTVTTLPPNGQPVAVTRHTQLSTQPVHAVTTQHTDVVTRAPRTAAVVAQPQVIQPVTGVVGPGLVSGPTPPGTLF